MTDFEQRQAKKLEELKKKEIENASKELENQIKYADVPEEYRKDKIVDSNYLDHIENENKQCIDNSLKIYKNAEALRTKLDKDTNTFFAGLDQRLKEKKEEINMNNQSMGIHFV